MPHHNRSLADSQQERQAVHTSSGRQQIHGENKACRQRALRLNWRLLEFLGRMRNRKNCKHGDKSQREESVESMSLNLLVDKWRNRKQCHLWLSVTFISERIWFIVQEMLLAYEELMNLISDVSFDDSFMQTWSVLTGRKFCQWNNQYRNSLLWLNLLQEYFLAVIQICPFTAFLRKNTRQTHNSSWKTVGKQLNRRQKYSII